MEQENSRKLGTDELDQVSGGTSAADRIITANCPTCGPVEAVKLSKSKCMCSNCGTTFSI